MASNNDAGEGAATLKRIKITKAQRTMFMFVCFASLALGITAVLAIYFSKSIAFENKVIKQKEYVIKALTKDQNSLEGMSAQIDALASNEYLESVATNRSSAIDCSKYNKRTAFSEYTSVAEAERARQCSSLRVVNDAMPSTTSTITLDDVDTTTRVQIALIMEDAQIDTDGDNDGVSLQESHSGNSSMSSSLIEPYSTLDLGINVSGDLNKLKNFLAKIDKSIRNFDLRSATLGLGDAGNMEFSGQYSAYYTNPVNLQVLKRTICADEKSDECIAAGGDKSVADGQGGSTGAVTPGLAE